MYSQPQLSFKCYYFKIVLWSVYRVGQWKQTVTKFQTRTETGEWQTDSQVTKSRESCKEGAPRTYVLYWFFNWVHKLHFCVYIKTTVLSFVYVCMLYHIFINEDPFNKTKFVQITLIHLWNLRYFNCGVRAGKIWRAHLRNLIWVLQTL